MFQPSMPFCASHIFTKVAYEASREMSPVRADAEENGSSRIAMSMRLRRHA